MEHDTTLYHKFNALGRRVLNHSIMTTWDKIIPKYEATRLSISFIPTTEISTYQCISVLWSEKLQNHLYKLSIFLGEDWNENNILWNDTMCLDEAAENTLARNRFETSLLSLMHTSLKMYIYCLVSGRKWDNNPLFKVVIKIITPQILPM